MKKISGLWFHTDSQGLQYIAVSLRETGRRLRVYFDTKPMPDSPDASLYTKQQDASYARVTGLWFRETRGGKNYLFLSLQEGNFRIFPNEFKKHEAQPDYVLYQLTDAQGLPVGQERAEPGGVPETVNESYVHEPVGAGVGGGQEEIPF